MAKSIYVIQRLGGVMITLVIGMTLPWFGEQGSMPLLPTASAQTPPTDDQLTEAGYLYLLAYQQYSQGQFQAALETLQKALAIYQAMGRRDREGATLNSIGEVYRNLGDYPKALEILEQALALNRETQNQVEEGTSLHNIGLVHLSQKDYTQALTFLQQALAINRKIGDQEHETTTLSNIGSVYQAQGQYTQALDFFEQALALYRESGDKLGEATLLSGIGEMYRSQGEYTQALNFFQQTLTAFQAAGFKVGESGALNSFGQVYTALGDYPKALDYFEQALAIVQEENYPPGEAIILTGIGQVYRSLGQYSQALKTLEQALKINQDLGDQSAEGATLDSIGSVYNGQGDYPQALQFYEQALALIQGKGNQTQEATTLNNIASVYSSLGKYPQALQFYQQALDIFQALGNKPEEGTTLNNIGGAYHSLGQYTQALNFYQQALAIHKEVGDQTGAGTSLNNIASIYNDLQEYDQALTFYEQALAVYTSVGNEAGKGVILNNIGSVYNSQGNYDQALSFFDQALAIQNAAGDQDGVGTTLHNIALVYDYQQEYPQALDFYQQAWEILKQVGDKRVQGLILTGIGSAYYNLGEFTEAEKTLRTAIDLLESVRPGLTDADKISIFETQSNTYLSLQNVLIAENKTDEALEIAERGRARAFVELLASRLPSNSNPSVTSQPLTIEQIKQIAQQEKATLVEYSTIKNLALYIWVVKPTGEVYSQQIDLQSQDTSLNNIVSYSRDVIGVSGRNSLAVVSQPRANPTDPLKHQQLQKLYQLLIAPIAELLPQNPNDRVIFIPHNELFLVPFAALQDESGQYLIEKHTILTAPAIQLLQLTHEKRLSLKRQNRTGEVLIVGNPTTPNNLTTPNGEPIQLPPLPGAEQEAIAIAHLFNITPLLGNQATKTTVTHRMENARIIHLATHGLLDDFKGLGVPGAIALAADPLKTNPSPNSTGMNGLLTASEILDLKLNAELVVLSACDTGRGRITGDGVIGLSRSFISAGVPSVIVSLWSIPDAPTATLMTEFYRQLQQNSDKAIALRQAMLITMKQHPDPKDWAAFTLIGEAD